MNTTLRDVGLIILLILSGAFLSITIFTIISTLNDVIMINNHIVQILMSAILGLLFGLNIWVVLNINTRKEGLFAVGLITAFIIKYAYLFYMPYNGLILGLISGVLISLISIFKLIEFNILKYYRYLLIILSLLFIYSLLAPVIYYYSTPQNNIIALGLILITMGILWRVVK